MTGVASFRLLTVPEVDGNSLRYRLPVQPTELALETGRMYRRATAFLVSLESIEKNLPESAGTRKPHPTLESWDVGVINGWEFSTEAEKKWLEENRETLERTITAAKRPRCAMENPYDQTATPHYEQKMFLTEKLESLFRLLLFSAKKLESEGKLAESWNHYLYAMRMCWHLDEHPHEIFFRTYHSRIYDWIGTWRLHPNQTAEILRYALEDLKAGSIAKKDRRTAIALMQIERTIKSAFEGESDSRSVNQDVHNSIRRTAAFLLPWEKTRALRVLNIINMEIRFHGRYNHEAYPSLMLLPQLDQFTLAPNVKNPSKRIENQKNLLMIRLALMIEKRKTGNYPELLEDLLGEYFDELPHDSEPGKTYRYYRNGLQNDLLYEGGKINANSPFLFNPFSGFQFFLIKASDKDNKLGKDYFILSLDRPKPDSSKKLVVGYASMVEAMIHLIDLEEVETENIGSGEGEE